MYLVDTCLLSDVFRKSPLPCAWLAGIPDTSVFVSMLTLGELRRGVLNLTRKDPRAAGRIGDWLVEVQRRFANRKLDVTEAVALRWAELAVQRTRPQLDALIAATALAHGLAVVTRNVADFADTGVVVVNPWESA